MGGGTSLTKPSNGRGGERSGFVLKHPDARVSQIFVLSLKCQQCLFCEQCKKRKCIFIFSHCDCQFRTCSPPPPLSSLSSPVFFSQWKSTARRFRPQIDGSCVSVELIPPCVFCHLQSLTRGLQMPQSSGFRRGCIDWRDRFDSGLRGECRWNGCLVRERAGECREWQADRLSLPLKGAAHGRPAGSSLTAIAGSTAALKRDPPLTQLSDGLFNCGAVYNYHVFFFAFLEEAPFFKSRDQQQQLCHLTCVGAQSLPVLSFPVPAETTRVFEPLLWS